MVEETLLLAEPEAGNLALSRGPVDVADVVSEAVDSLGPGAVAKALLLELDLDEGLIVEGDRGRLGQVVDNLLSNACCPTRSSTRRSTGGSWFGPSRAMARRSSR